MYYKTIFTFIILPVMFCCENRVEDFITTKTVTEEFKSTCIVDDCALVTVDYIKLVGEKRVVDTINFIIANSIIHFLNPNNTHKTKSITVSEAANLFLKEYEADKKEFPELSPYQAEIIISKSSINSKVVSIKTKYYSYTGGAHGNTTYNFYNFNSLTGKLLTQNDLFKNKDGFRKFAEKLFREENNIPASDPINSTGFWFENNSFMLPKSIGISDENMILIYNTYEIASYADGTIELIIPKEKVQNYLNF